MRRHGGAAAAGAAGVEYFTAAGSRPLDDLQITCPKAVVRMYDRGLKGACIKLDGELAPSCRVAIPRAKGARSFTVRHPVIVVQLFASEGSSLYFEFIATDGHERRRAVLSTACAAASVDHFHVKLPIPRDAASGVVRNTWTNVCFDITSIFGAGCAVEHVIIGASCRVRRIGAVKQPIPQLFAAIARGEAGYPSILDFPPGVHHVTQLVGLGGGGGGGGGAGGGGHNSSNASGPALGLASPARAAGGGGGHAGTPPRRHPPPALPALAFPVVDVGDYYGGAGDAGGDAGADAGVAAPTPVKNTPSQPPPARGGGRVATPTRTTPSAAAATPSRGSGPGGVRRTLPSAVKRVGTGAGSRARQGTACSSQYTTATSPSPPAAPVATPPRAATPNSYNPESYSSGGCIVAPGRRAGVGVAASMTSSVQSIPSTVRLGTHDDSTLAAAGVQEQNASSTGAGALGSDDGGDRRGWPTAAASTAAGSMRCDTDHFSHSGFTAVRVLPARVGGGLSSTRSSNAAMEVGAGAGRAAAAAAPPTPVHALGTLPPNRIHPQSTPPHAGKASKAAAARSPSARDGSDAARPRYVDPMAARGCGGHGAAEDRDGYEYEREHQDQHRTHDDHDDDDGEGHDADADADDVYRHEYGDGREGGTTTTATTRDRVHQLPARLRNERAAGRTRNATTHATRTPPSKETASAVERDPQDATARPCHGTAAPGPPRKVWATPTKVDAEGAAAGSYRHRERSGGGYAGSGTSEAFHDGILDVVAAQGGGRRGPRRHCDEDSDATEGDDDNDDDDDDAHYAALHHMLRATREELLSAQRDRDAAPPPGQAMCLDELQTHQNQQPAPRTPFNASPPSRITHGHDGNDESSSSRTSGSTLSAPPLPSPVLRERQRRQRVAWEDGRDRRTRGDAGRQVARESANAEDTVAHTQPPPSHPPSYHADDAMMDSYSYGAAVVIGRAGGADAECEPATHVAGGTMGQGAVADSMPSPHARADRGNGDDEALMDSCGYGGVAGLYCGGGSGGGVVDAGINDAVATATPTHLSSMYGVGRTGGAGEVHDAATRGFERLSPRVDAPAPLPTGFGAGAGGDGAVGASVACGPPSQQVRVQQQSGTRLRPSEPLSRVYTDAEDLAWLREIERAAAGGSARAERAGATTAAAAAAGPAPPPPHPVASDALDDYAAVEAALAPARGRGGVPETSVNPPPRRASPAAAAAAAATAGPHNAFEAAGIAPAPAPSDDHRRVGAGNTSLSSPHSHSRYDEGTGDVAGFGGHQLVGHFETTPASDDFEAIEAALAPTPEQWGLGRIGRAAAAPAPAPAPAPGPGPSHDQYLRTARPRGRDETLSDDFEAVEAALAPTPEQRTHVHERVGMDDGSAGAAGQHLPTAAAPAARGHAFEPLAHTALPVYPDLGQESQRLRDARTSDDFEAVEAALAPTPEQRRGRPMATASVGAAEHDRHGTDTPVTHDERRYSAIDAVLAKAKERRRAAQVERGRGVADGGPAPAHATCYREGVEQAGEGPYPTLAAAPAPAPLDAFETVESAVPFAVERSVMSMASAIHEGTSGPATAGYPTSVRAPSGPGEARRGAPAWPGVEGSTTGTRAYDAFDHVLHAHDDHESPAAALARALDDFEALESVVEAGGLLLVDSGSACRDNTDTHRNGASAAAAANAVYDFKVRESEVECAMATRGGWGRGCDARPDAIAGVAPAAAGLHVDTCALMGVPSATEYTGAVGGDEVDTTDDFEAVEARYRTGGRVAAAAATAAEWRTGEGWENPYHSTPAAVDAAPDRRCGVQHTTSSNAPWGARQTQNHAAVPDDATRDRPASRAPPSAVERTAACPPVSRRHVAVQSSLSIVGPGLGHGHMMTTNDAAHLRGAAADGTMEVSSGWRQHQQPQVDHTHPPHAGPADLNAAASPPRGSPFPLEHGDSGTAGGVGGTGGSDGVRRGRTSTSTSSTARNAAVAEPAATVATTTTPAARALRSVPLRDTPPGERRVAGDAHDAVRTPRLNSHALAVASPSTAHAASVEHVRRVAEWLRCVDVLDDDASAPASGSCGMGDARARASWRVSGVDTGADAVDRANQRRWESTEDYSVNHAPRGVTGSIEVQAEEEAVTEDPPAAALPAPHNSEARLARAEGVGVVGQQQPPQRPLSPRPTQRSKPAPTALTKVERQLMAVNKDARRPLSGEAREALRRSILAGVPQHHSDATSFSGAGGVAASLATSAVPLIYHAATHSGSSGGGFVAPGANANASHMTQDMVASIDTGLCLFEGRSVLVQGGGDTRPLSPLFPAEQHPVKQRVPRSRSVSPIDAGNVVRETRGAADADADTLDDVCIFESGASRDAASALSDWSLPAPHARAGTQRTLYYDPQLQYYFDPTTGEYYADP